jgi:hypothetical protein
MDVTATLSKSRVVKENGGGKVYHIINNINYKKDLNI